MAAFSLLMLLIYFQAHLSTSDFTSFGFLTQAAGTKLDYIISLRGIQQLIYWFWSIRYYKVVVFLLIFHLSSS